MVKEEKIRLEGIIKKILPATNFEVELENGHEIIAHLCGKMRMNYIKIVPGDKVIVEISPYDLKRGRIIKRI
jgi:translation initiation factor IF-1